jgi:hypothetical protein
MWMVFDHAHEQLSQWAVLQSIDEKIRCSGEKLRSWVREVDWPSASEPGLPPTSAHA